MADLPSGTVTFLFTDIEGSTRLLKQLRESYRELLNDHEELMREAFDEADGSVVDTQGDAFFVVFSRAKDALSAAVAAQRAHAAHHWPGGVEVRVRMAIHTGEPLLGANRYVGLGLHRAARICGAAHGGQVLVSDATRAVVEDELPDSIALRDLGLHELKDLDRPERLFQLVAPDLPKDFPAPRAGPASPVFAGREEQLLEAAQVAAIGWRGRRRQLRLVAALAGLFAVVASVIAVLRPSDGDREVVVSANSVAVIDPDTNKIIDSVTVGTAPSNVAVGEGAVWVLNGEDRTVSRIDPKTMDATTVGTGTTPTDLTVGGGFVWLVSRCPDSTVYRLDPDSNHIESLAQLRSRCPPGEPRPSYIAYGEGSIWVANNREDLLWRIHPRRGAVQATIRLPGVSADYAGEGIAVGEGAVWVNRAGSVVRIDPRTNSTSKIDIPLEFGWIAAGEGGVWTADNVILRPGGPKGTLWRIDPALEAAVKAIEVGEGPRGVAVGAGSVWVVNGASGTVSRVDPLDNEVESTIDVGGTPRGVAVGEGTVWVTIS
jgi:YVTN family beta-propeller protein